jgi:hypothetical protein
MILSPLAKGAASTADIDIESNNGLRVGALGAVKAPTEPTRDRSNAVATLIVNFMFRNSGSRKAGVVGCGVLTYERQQLHARDFDLVSISREKRRPRPRDTWVTPRTAFAASQASKLRTVRRRSVPRPRAGHSSSPPA